MPDTMEDFKEYYRKKTIARATPEQRLEGLPAEVILKGLPAKERLKGLPVEVRLKGLPLE